MRIELKPEGLTKVPKLLHCSYPRRAMHDQDQ
jgi:hypothetical protein